MDLEHPEATFFESRSRELLGSVRATRQCDPFLGRRARALVTELGFESVGHEGTVWACHPGDPGHGLFTRTWEVGVRLSLEAGAISEEDARRFRALAGDPSFALVDGSIWGAWGRRPVPPGAGG